MRVRVIEPISVDGERVEPSSDVVELNDEMAGSLAALGCVAPAYDTDTTETAHAVAEVAVDTATEAPAEPSRRKRHR